MQSDGELIAAVLQVYTNEPARGGMLENAKVRQLGDRYFVVGTLAALGSGMDDERVGMLFWFPLDEVYMLTEFPNLDVARERYLKHAEKRQEKTESREEKKRGWFT